MALALGLRRGEALALHWADVKYVQDVLGHSSPTVTKTIYVEATRRVQKDAVVRLGFLFDE